MTYPALALAGVDLALSLSCLIRPSFVGIGLFYAFNTIIVPLVLGVVAAAGFAVWNRRPYERHIVLLALAYAAAALLLVAARVWATHIEPHRLKLRHVAIQTDKVSRPFRILHISDIQSAEVGAYEERTFALMSQLSILDMPVDLCLAGHTHGGQIRLPLIGPLVTLSQVPRAWARGFREVGRTRLNVSAGIGCEHADNIPAIRIHCPPEMTLIELLPESPAPAPVALNEEESR